MTPVPLRPDYGASARAAMTSLTRAAIATGLRHLSYDYGGHEKQWPNDRDVGLVLRAATAPATTVNAAALTRVAYAFLDALVPFSAAAALIARSLQLDFGGNLSISLPALVSPLSDFVGQGRAVPVTMGTSSAITLAAFKLAVITVLSGEMMRHGAAEAVVRQVLLADVGPALDAALFSAAAGVVDIRPPGLLNGLTGLTPSASTVKSEAMVDDVAALAAATAPVAGNAPIVLIAAAQQGVALAMRPPGATPFPVFTSSTLPAKRVIAVAPGALVTAFDVPEIDASKHAALHMEGATPADIAGTGGAIAFPVRSMLQVDSVALKLRLPVAWALRSPTAIAFVDNVVW